MNKSEDKEQCDVCLFLVVRHTQETQQLRSDLQGFLFWNKFVYTRAVLLTYSVKQRRKTQFESGWGDENIFEISPLFFFVNYICPLHNLGDITYIALSKGAKHSLKVGGGTKSFASEAKIFL